MPNLTLEYSNNIKAKVDFKRLFQDLHQILAIAGDIDIRNCKSRSLKREVFLVAEGEPVVHATMGLSLTCDHRMLDGAPAAEFLRILMDYLETPFGMLVQPKND